MVVAVRVRRAQHATFGPGWKGLCARMSIAEAAARARHDLGKYICFSARWLPDGAPVEELREALRDDLLRTRKGPTGVTGAVALWAELRTPLIPAGIEAIDARMGRVAALAASLDTLDAPALAEAAALARAVADELRDLHARTRS